MVSDADWNRFLKSLDLDPKDFPNGSVPSVVAEEEEPEEKTRPPQLLFDPEKSRLVQNWRFGHGTYQ